jgi:hypothetical protein
MTAEPVGNVVWAQLTQPFEVRLPIREFSS